ncbi:hypothetical protein BJ085DRAFT_15323 [Dimargaris cristalligena]|uniref:MT-A70-domain-containing protein n=1 Tax=Dimargaris cristalligena TaxID=215637 RepID=A0A4P9ZYN4_9FUNG|nr:hypothetical protein BJ085DRAFT_15323 [Dimargaris cristalligena]|eukprot:RKP38181.1 hypothetical protein BJ085DRAFT_15323 [Dimargaris cristalligena]
MGVYTPLRNAFLVWFGVCVCGTTNSFSNAHYVGYVEDDESVDAIMKKFEELERIQQQFASQATKSNLGSSSTNAPPPLTQEQLEEVFRQTSSFTVKTATIDIDDYDESEWWKAEMEDADTTEYIEENDYVAVDDEFWDEEFGAAPTKKRVKGTRPATTLPPREKEARRPRHDKESIIQRYRIMQVKLQDKHGNYFFIRKKVSTVDPSLPTYVRIPPIPIPHSWVFHITQLIEQATPPPSSRQLHDDVLTMDLLSLGQSYQAIYMDPPLLLPGESPTPGKITVDQLCQLKVDQLTPNGFLFIWVEKELLPDIVGVAAQWKFKYVENFCWIKKRVNNLIVRQPSTYFCKSKLTLLIFRKEGEIDIRHQRSADSLFDFIKPTEPEFPTERKPLFLYQLIETLLPLAMPTEQSPLPNRLLELWARPDQPRFGWTSVSQKYE